jgi:geranylgeranyl reductase family protein
MDYDVVVAGGGPAGSSAAFHLAKRDIRVLVIDKETFPRDKICGDGVAPRAVRTLYKMGLQERLDGKFNKFHGFRLAGPGRTLIETPIPPTPSFPDHGYIIKRIDLDKTLLDYARENGAEVWEGCRVIAPLLEDGRVVGVRALCDDREVEVTAEVVVGADGPHSTLGKAMGLLQKDPRYLGISIRQYFEGAEQIGDHLEIYSEKAIIPASGWIFPVSQSVANVGVGAMLYHIRQRKMVLHSLLEAFVNETPHSSPKLKNARPVSPERAELLRVGLGGSKVECPGMILVGDAASMTNPVSGEGITFALETGEMAADHILESRTGGRGIHHDPGEDSFRRKLTDRYEHYFNMGIKSIKWLDRTWVMRPGIAFVSHSRKRVDFLVRALMYMRH